ncbi:MAG: hypothetical protein ACI8RZ_007496 [Myxococcota bacterium]|jgi:hypothetical protein
MDLRAALLDAVRPESFRDRLRLRLTGGYTAVQVFNRLTTEVQHSLMEGAVSKSAGSHQAISTLQQTMDEMVREGTLRRQTSKLQTSDGRGPRSVMVDVYRIDSRKG